jgi:hypothetical protein
METVILYYVRISPLLEFVLSQMNPACTIILYFLRAYINTVILYKKRLSKWSPVAGLETRISYAFITSPYMLQA